MTLESVGCRPGVMPSILQCPGQPSNNKIWPQRSVMLRLRDPGPKWDWKMNAVLGETGSSGGDISSVSRGKSYFKGESRLWWRMVQKSWLSYIRSRSILSLVRRRSFLTMVRLFLQNGSYNTRWRGLREKEGAWKQLVCEKGEFLVIMAITVTSSYMPATMPNALWSLSRLFHTTTLWNVDFCVWMRK